MQRLQRELDALANADAEYERLLQEKERLLTESDGPGAKRLVALAEQLAELSCDKRELGEAIQAGQEAVSSLRQVSSELQSAADWGTWDMLGGGMLSTMAKHSKIDSAKQHALQAQERIRRFQEELSDAGRRLHVSLEIGGFSKFADYFFDGLIADWVVQSKIQEASSACSSTMTQVSTAVNECRRRLADVEKAIAQLTTERREFVEREA